MMTRIVKLYRQQRAYMTNYIKRSPLFILVLLFLAVESAHPQSQNNQSDAYESVFIYAKNLADNGMTKEAALEHKRYLFLQNYAQGTHKVESLTFLAHYYSSLGDNETALEYQTSLVQELCFESKDSGIPSATLIQQAQLEDLTLMRTVIISHSSSSQTELSDSSRNLSIAKLNALAWTVLANQNQTITPTIKKAACCNLMLIACSNTNFTALQTLFVTACNTYPDLFSDDERVVLRKAIGTAFRFTPKNPLVGGWLSVIPGAGQLYAHNWTDALNAFVLNGSLIAASAYSLSNLQFVDFSFFELNPLIRFYRGNLYNAQRDVFIYNYSKQNELTSPIISILSHKLDVLSSMQ